MGPIGVKKHLAPFLPSHPMVSTSFIVVDIFGHVFYYIHYKVHGQNHTQGNMQPSQLHGSVLQSSGLPQVIMQLFVYIKLCVLIEISLQLVIRQFTLYK